MTLDAPNLGSRIFHVAHTGAHRRSRLVAAVVADNLTLSIAAPNRLIVRSADLICLSLHLSSENINIYYIN